VKIYKGEDLPHMLIDGVPQKDTVKDKEFTYYFMSIDPANDYLYAVATANLGEIKMYIDFVDQSKNTKSGELVMPSVDHNKFKSKTVGHSELIHLKKTEVKEACGDFKDCLLVIGVRGEAVREFSEYTLIAYSHLPILTSNSPMISKIDSDSMNYFAYRSQCESCSIIISASSFSVEDDIDMYINIGKNKQLPTREEYDIKSEQWFSEMVEINLDHDYFKGKKVDSMKGVYLIGIYAKKETTISIEIEDSPFQIKQIRSNKGIQVNHDQSTTKYFKYVHNEKKSLKFELTMLSGFVTMRINKHLEYIDDNPFHKYLPADDANSIWKTESMKNTTILISSEDRKF